MSDIFQVKGVDAVLRIGDKEYKFADPSYLKKVLLRKKFKSLGEEGEKLEDEIFAKKLYELNKEQVKLYLPDIEEDVFKSLGDFAFTALLRKLLEITQDTFGATVEKVEGK